MACNVKDLIEGKVSGGKFLGLEGNSAAQGERSTGVSAAINGGSVANRAGGPGIGATSKNSSNTVPSAAGSSGSAVTSATPPYNPTSLSYLESAVNNIRNVDCIQNVKNFVGVGKGGYVDSAAAIYNNYLKGIVGEKFLQDIGQLVGYQDSSFTMKDRIIRLICVNVSSWFQVLSALIEQVLKIVPTIFDKIDKLLNKAMRLLAELSSIISQCLLQVLSNLKNLAKNLITGLLDLESLRNAMAECPCILHMVAKLFGCPDSYTADEVISCLTEKFNDLVGPILKAIEKGFQVIVKMIEGIFERLNATIKKIMDSIFAVLRSLMRQYCKLLSKKMNVDPIVKIAKSFNMECLLVYTQENGPLGTKYYGMNVYDIMNTFTIWGNCITDICDLLGPNIRLQMKQYTEKLRLNIQFWDNPLTADLFTVCTQSMQYSASDVGVDKLRSIWSAGKPSKSVVDNFHDSIKNAQTEFSNANPPVTDDPTYYPATANMISPEGGTSDGEPSISGIQPTYGVLSHYPNISGDLSKIVESMSKFFPTDTFYRKFLEMKDWLMMYKSSAELYNSITKASSNFMNSLSKEVNFSGLVGIDLTKDEPSPDYAVSSDLHYYDFGSRPTMENGESRQALYKKWFSQAHIA
jgi:hypothetical protein